MLIDPQGLLQGDRISACSDEAQLHFPRLMAASNGYGRFRLSVEWLLTNVYASLRQKPTKEQIQGWMHEYHANFLLFVYRAPDGATWGHWEIPENLLGRFRSATDRKSPEPPAAEHHAYRASYIEALRVKNAANDDLFCDDREIPKTVTPLECGTQTHAHGTQTHAHGVETHASNVGVGVGVGEGVGEVFAQNAPQPVPFKRLYTQIRELFGDAPWDGSEAKALDALLQASPGLSVSTVRRCLEHRSKSDVNLAERPRKWIRNLLDYELGPLDAYGKPKALSKRPETYLSVTRAPNVAQTASVLQREDEERRMIIDEWRSAESRDGAPVWVKRVLEAGSTESRVA